VPGNIINLLPPEITKGNVSRTSPERSVPMPAAAVPKFGRPSILIPDNFWSNLVQFLTERPVKVRERKDAPFTRTSFGAGIGDNLKDFFSSGPAPKGPVDSKLAVAWGANFGGFGTRIKEFFSPPKQAPLPFAVKPMKVKDIVLMGRLLKKPPPRLASNHDIEVAKTALKQVDMFDMWNHPFPELSGGQRQRVLVARALAG
jgi:ABC-type sugar transport system ATPase subunit